jgi:hypothetical protein
VAAQYAGDLFAFDGEGNTVPVADAAALDPTLRGHVQAAIVLGILKPDLVTKAVPLSPSSVRPTASAVRNTR